jgi:hypothetical protein
VGGGVRQAVRQRRGDRAELQYAADAVAPVGLHRRHCVGTSTRCRCFTSRRRSATASRTHDDNVSPELSPALTAVSVRVSTVHQVPNEALHLTCQKLHNVTRPSFDDLNRVAARALASVLLPTTHSASTEASSGVNGGAEGELGRSTTMLGDVVQHLCAHPRHRVLSLRSVPQMPATSVDFTVLQWPGLLKRLRQMQITGARRA